MRRKRTPLVVTAPGQGCLRSISHSFHDGAAGNKFGFSWHFMQRRRSRCMPCTFQVRRRAGHAGRQNDNPCVPWNTARARGRCRRPHRPGPISSIDTSPLDGRCPEAWEDERKKENIKARRQLPTLRSSRTASEEPWGPEASSTASLYANGFPSSVRPLVLFPSLPSPWPTQPTAAPARIHAHHGMHPGFPWALRWMVGGNFDLPTKRTLLHGPGENAQDPGRRWMGAGRQRPLSVHPRWVLVSFFSNFSFDDFLGF